MYHSAWADQRPVQRNIFYISLQPGQYIYIVQEGIRAISRLTVVSREAKKKQHARASSGLRDHYSELFTRMAALKF